MTMSNDLNLSACACMGPIGEDPYCPCRMRQMGLEPTLIWTPEARARLDAAFREIFELEASAERGSKS